MRRARRRALAGAAFAGALALAGGPPARADGRAVELESPGRVGGIRLADLDGDGTLDLVVLDGREILVFPGRRGALPAPAPRWRGTVPPAVSFVAAPPPAGGPPGEGSPAPAGGAPRRPALVLVGSEGLALLDLESGKSGAHPAGALGSLGWVDEARASFADLVDPGGWLHVPVEDGWRLLPPGEGTPLAIELTGRLDVDAPPGPLGEAGLVTQARPPVFVGAPLASGGPPVLWSLEGGGLLAAVGARRVRLDLDLLPVAGERVLLDLDGDRRPELLHRSGTNQESVYAFFRLPALRLAEGRLHAERADLGAPTSVVRLGGFVLEPVFTDLDGDGRLDLVLTSIPIDARNTVRALAGRMTAHTHAFLGREGEASFRSVPDATISSDIGVAIRLSKQGTISVIRSYTILATADLDGDGRRDLLLRDRPDRLRVHPGTAAGVWAAEAGWRISIPPMEEGSDLDAWAGDLTGDGKDELVLVYRGQAGGHDRVHVVRGR